MPHVRALVALAALGLAAPGLVACEKDPLPPQAPPQPYGNGAYGYGGYGYGAPGQWMTPAGAPVPRADAMTPTSGSIHIDDRIQRACGNLPTAHFAFDSASLQPDAGAALEALARCFTSGPLAGHSMLLTGHTDPRGELEYNMALGQRRAGSVASHLEGRGVARGHMTTTSHGELDATGNDEAGWARDRKVDVSLAD